MFTGLLVAWLAATPEDPAGDAGAPAALETVTVEAAKAPLEPSRVAAAVTVIDTERMERELVQSVSDLVRYEPGVDVVDQGSRFGFSGIAIRGIGGNRVQTEVDGVALADAFSIGDFSSAGRDFIDVESLKQVEILRGPASTLFGSNAIGGVVSFVTKDARDYLGDDDTHFDLRLGYNDLDASTVASGTAAARAGAFTGLLRVTRRDGEERDAGLSDPLDFETRNLLAKLAWGEPGNGGLEFTLDAFENESRTDVRSLVRTQDFSELFGFPYLIDTTAVRGDDSRERTRISLEQEWVGGRFGVDYLRWRAYWQDSETRQDTFEARETIIFGEPTPVERLRSFRFEQELAGLELNAGSVFSTGPLQHELSYGIEYELADTAQLRDGRETDLATGESSSTVGPDVFPLRDFPLSETERYGVYLEDRISLGPVTLIPAIRYDRFALAADADPIFLEDNPGIEVVDVDESAWTPRLGALWDLGERWQLFGQYAEGFRAPPYNDVNVGFTNFQFGYTAIPNPDLEPESSRGVELGLRYGDARRQLTVTAFNTRYDDFIAPFQVVGFDPVNELLIFQSVNLEEVEIEGAELSGSWAPDFLPAGMSLSAAAAYARGEDRRSGEPLNGVAPLNGVLGLDYAPAGGRWGLSFLARGAARQDRLDTSGGELLSPGGYVVLDALAFYEPTASSRLRLGLFNIADREYTPYLNVQGVPADVSSPQRFEAPGRHFSLAFDYRF